jgi:hypothetical protein
MHLVKTCTNLHLASIMPTVCAADSRIAWIYEDLGRFADRGAAPSDDDAATETPVCNHRGAYMYDEPSADDIYPKSWLTKPHASVDSTIFGRVAIEYWTQNQKMPSSHDREPSDQRIFISGILATSMAMR